MIQQQQQHQETTAANSERNTNFARRPAQLLPAGPQLPPWMVDVPIQAQNQNQPANLGRFNSSRAHCPETVWRAVRWPMTEAGLVVQMPCPAHARPSNPLEQHAASFACLPNGQWAARVQANKCQSIWLRNLTKRLEKGDSQLSILSELVQETRPPATPLLVNWLAGVSQQPTITSAPTMITQGPALFGADVAQISRLVRRLVEDLGDFLNRITDDKTRLAFAREIVQVSV